MSDSRAPLVLGVVPARGGSRGVPMKNVRPLGGHPLIAYTVAAGRACKRLTTLVVSTEDPEIAAVARALGVDVVDRPPELATDDAPMVPVVQHAIAEVERSRGTTYDYVLVLQPTTPFRRGADIDAAIDLLEGAADPDASVIGIVRVFDGHPARVKRLVDGRLEPYQGADDQGIRRQDLPPAYLRNGAIYLSHRHTILGGSIWGEHQLPYEMPPERSVNIDEPLDLILAEAILQEGLTEIDLARGRAPSRDQA